ncbi:MAG: MoaD/ThiS family protein [Bacteroidetes bacterium]|nr:MoaD/ThiS family protein [Bacteroidota bacterium]
MATRVFIPTPLRAYTENRSEVPVEASDVQSALDALVAQHPELRRHLFDDAGALRSFVNVYLNDDDIRYLSAGRIAIGEHDVISIIPAIAGGLAA